MTRTAPERAVATAVIHWLRMVLPRGSIVANIETEKGASGETWQQRARYHQARIKGGVVPGFPDAVAMLPNGETIWFEWKAAGGIVNARGKLSAPGIVSDDQQRIHERAAQLGHLVIVATSIETCRFALIEAGYSLGEAAGQCAAPVQVRHERRRDDLNEGMPF